MATDGVRMTEIGDQPRPVATGVSVDDGTRDRRGRSSVGFEPRSLPSIPYDFMGSRREETHRREVTSAEGRRPLLLPKRTGRAETLAAAQPPAVEDRRNGPDRTG